MYTTVISIIAILALLFLICMRMPVAFALAFVGLGGVIALQGVDCALGLLFSMPYESTASWVFICVPLFVLAGQLALYADISTDAYDIGNKLFGRLPGGLAIGTIIGCGFFAATSGVSVATAATMGSIAIPEMEKHGYDLKLATGSVAAGGLLGIMIPPSVPLVLYGFITEQSIGALLIGGVIPGILTIVVFSLGVVVMVMMNPRLAPLGEVTSFREKLRSLPKAWRFLLIIGVVIGGIYSGIFTVTEAAANGAFCAFILLLLRHGKKSLKVMPQALELAGTVTSMVFIIMLGATFFTTFLSLARIPYNVTTFMTSLDVSPYTLLALVLFLYIPLGMFLDTVSIMLITLPIVFPIIQALNFSGIWFGILMIKMCEIGLITPPVGLNVYVISGIAKNVDLTDIFRGASRFIILELITLGLLILFPQLVLYLPGMMK